MTMTLDQDRLRRYKSIGALLLKYGRAGIVSTEKANPLSQSKPVADTAPSPEELAADLEAMGPLFIKLGQVLSSRPDLLPSEYVEALTRLQDSLPAFPYEEVRSTVEEELGIRVSKAFREFDEKPLAAASLGQVHRAVLRSGRLVAVKVQRPGIRTQIAQDLDALEDVAGLANLGGGAAGTHLRDILAEFRDELARELDYRQEAGNLERLAESLKSFEHIFVPRPVAGMNTSRVLVMDFVHGRKITSIGPLAYQAMDGESLADEVFRAYLQQVLVDGFFHADPHPGNVLITDDYRVALIDVGMVGTLSPRMQERLLKLLIAISEGRGDEAAEEAIKIGDRHENFDEPEFRRSIISLVANQATGGITNLRIGSTLLEVSRISGNLGIGVPRELALLSKTLLNLDDIGRALAPGFDPNASIRRNAMEITRQRALKSVSMGNLASAAIEAREFAAEFPGRVNKILDSVARNQLQIKVHAFDENTLIEGFQKVANRIATGVVLGSLIIGAAMLMRVHTTFTLFGYPGLAMLCFLGAAGGGAALIISILMSDRRARKPRSH